MGHVALMREIRNAYKILIGNREGMRSSARSKRRMEVSIETDPADHSPSSSAEVKE